LAPAKTTLAALLLRFYDVTQGSIRVDGVDIRQMSQKELRQRFAYVPQRAMLFTGTIAENLRYGKPDATDGEVRHAAESAQAAEFIERLDEGYDALIAQGGYQLLWRAKAAADHRPGAGPPAQDLHLRRQFLGAGL